MKTIYIVGGIAINEVTVVETEALELLKLPYAFDNYEDAYWYARAQDL